MEENLINVSNAKTIPDPSSFSKNKLIYTREKNYKCKVCDVLNKKVLKLGITASSIEI